MGRKEGQINALYHKALVCQDQQLNVKASEYYAQAWLIAKQDYKDITIEQYIQEAEGFQSRDFPIAAVDLYDRAFILINNLCVNEGVVDSHIEQGIHNHTQNKYLQRS